MATYIQIGSTVTVGSGGAANIDFTSIPSTYTDLLLVGSLRSTYGSDSDGCFMRINNSSSGYSFRFLYGSGSGVASGTATYGISTTYINVSSIGAATTTASTFSNHAIYLPNYTSSNNKSVSIDGVSEINATAPAYAWLAAGLWSNSAAVNQITLSLPANGANFAQYSTATLYGISKS